MFCYPGWYLSPLFCIVIQSCILVVVIFICLIKLKWNFCIVTTVIDTIFFVVNSCFLWNTLPSSTVNCTTYMSFKSSLRRYLSCNLYQLANFNIDFFIFIITLVFLCHVVWGAPREAA